MRTVYYITLAIVFIAFSCESNKPEPFLDTDEYGLLIADMMVSKNNIEILKYSSDTAYKFEPEEIHFAVLRKYNLTYNQFQELNKYYSGNNHLYFKALEVAEESIQEKVNSLETTKDSIVSPKQSEL